MKDCLSIIVHLLFFLMLSDNLWSATITWTGSTDTDWHKKCNWNSNTIPTCTDDVIIPNVVNDPVISGVAHCNTIDIQSSSGALLTIQSSTGGLLEIGACPTAKTDNGGCVEYYVFVSSSAYSSTTSVATRDAACASNASSAGLSGTYKAWISNSGSNNISSTTGIAYKRAGDDVKVADDWSDLTDGSLDAAIDNFANGGNASGYQVWTGIGSNGTATSWTCSNWGNKSFSGTYGTTSQTNADWTADGVTSCEYDIWVDDGYYNPSSNTAVCACVDRGQGWQASFCSCGCASSWSSGPCNPSGGSGGLTCGKCQYKNGTGALEKRHYCFQIAA